ncbi:hypothetical protein LOAG_10486 [Loa loa]|uniref:Uncharacterized protein n=1 Tax=Loa loa TaxID=7209 RepID=A0A1S0TRC8_LOALO|nr:hypothetical protein LOAG_10486 [Loa loa]EFO18013.2 hypothetical protein LOAG_10486 [Loa loa]
MSHASGLQLKVKQKIFRQSVLYLIFHDKTAIVVHVEETMQRLTSSFAEVVKIFALAIILKEVELTLLYQPESQHDYHHSHITAGRFMTSDAKIEKERD